MYVALTESARNELSEVNVQQVTGFIYTMLQESQVVRPGVTGLAGSPHMWGTLVVERGTCWRRRPEGYHSSLSPSGRRSGNGKTSNLKRRIDYIKFYNKSLGNSG